ncbi:MAG: ADP-ribosylglycohydrolase family protein [Chloroflexi bacterium]|nr:MAG: ADP-ribosylglycohydrolase family protein [Chloroflexota bacterium]
METSQTSFAQPLYQKVFGLLAGGAIGDAFGIRVEMMHYKDIEEQYGRVEHFDPIPWRTPSKQPPGELWNPFGVQPKNEQGYHPLGRWSKEVGAYTDDMRYRLITCQAILRKQGPVTGLDLAEEWLNYRLMAEGAQDFWPTLSWPGPERAYARIVASMPNLAAMATSQRPLRAGWDAQLGLLYPGEPDQAAGVGYSMAVAVAAALVPGATLDGVIEQVLKYAGSLGSQANEFSGRLARLLDIAAHCPDVYSLREPFYKHFLVSFPPWDAVFSLEMVPCAIAMCFIAKGDARQAIIGAANIGRDADTIAAIAGELMGVLYGAQALPAEWVEKVLRLNPSPDLQQMAKDLCVLITERAEEKKKAAEGILSA